MLRYSFVVFRYLMRKYWQNLTLTTSIGLYLSYLIYFRTRYFIDRANSTLHLFEYKKQINALIIKKCVDALRDDVLKEQIYVQYTAKALLDLVLHDEFTKKLMTDLFIEMLRGKDFTAETKKLVEWAILNYLKDDNLGKK